MLSWGSVYECHLQVPHDVHMFISPRRDLGTFTVCIVSSWAHTVLTLFSIRPFPSAIQPNGAAPVPIMTSPMPHSQMKKD